MPRDYSHPAAGLVLVSKIEGGKKIDLAPPRLLKHLHIDSPPHCVML